MKSNVSYSRQSGKIDILEVAGSICSSQKETGEIPWSPGDKTDPWDHVEAVMGLTLGGFFKEARLGYRWLAENQLPDGSWYAEYKDGLPKETRQDANMTSYIAVGIYHYYLVTENIRFVEEMWDTVERAIDFTVDLQAPGGEIQWSVDRGVVDSMALLTGSSSIYMSLKCALALARALGKKRPRWKDALIRLGDAIRNKPHLFNMTKSRYSMDWFYPILSGAITGKEAGKRVEAYWKKFVITGQGVRCVSDQPWVTIAETSEFVLALRAMGNPAQAEIVFNWICDRRYDDGSYWCGYTFPDMVVWPEEKVTWTNGVVLMAADALYNLTPASRLFNHDFWEEQGLEKG